MVVVSDDSRAQVTVLNVAHQQPGALQVTPDPVADPLDERIEFGAARRVDPAERQGIGARDIHPVEEQHVKMAICYVA